MLLDIDAASSHINSLLVQTYPYNTIQNPYKYIDYFGQIHELKKSVEVRLSLIDRSGKVLQIQMEMLVDDKLAKKKYY